MTLDNILEEIKKAESILILTHENPDGDAIGCATAMFLILEQLGKKADLVLPEYPKSFNFLPGVEKAKIEAKTETYDLAIALDSATIKLLGTQTQAFEEAKTKVVIDHHGSNTMYGDLNYVDPKSPACAQVLAGVINYLGIDVTKDIATCLITGIITDTGGFAYSGVNADTFEIAARVLEKGVNISKIYQQVYSNISPSRFRLQRVAMDRIELLENNKVAFTYITKEDERKANAENGDHEGIVEIGRNIEGVEVSVFLRESEKGIKVSLRSKEYVNVSEICVAFGGGGHPRAAGCTIAGTMEQAKKQVINKIREKLE